jgi:peptidoglycan/LPS O-acetylase OafA/YrhL
MNVRPDTKYAGLDHLRALAIILVFLCHYRMFGHPDWVKGIGKFGWIGVDLFFVLSGFLIAGQLFSNIRQGKGVELKSFYLKRFFRIIPAYLAVLTVYFTVPSFKEIEGLAPLWKYLTFTQNFGLDLSNSRAFSHAWSLCIEEQFYLLLPFVVLCFLHFKAPAKAFYLVFALFIAGFVIRAVSWQQLVSPEIGKDGQWFSWYEWIYYPTYNRLDGLLAGICIAGVFQFRPQWKERITKYGNLFLILSLILLTVAYFMFIDSSSFITSVFGFPLVSVAFGAMVIAALSPSCFLYRASARITGIIATLSYSIYLSHKGVVNVTQDWAAQWGIARDSNRMMLICALSTILVALLMRYIVEKPFMKLRDRLLERNREEVKTTLVKDVMKKAG